MRVEKLIYLATPYTKYLGGKEEAFITACQVAGKIMEEGYAVFCPIAHSHSIEKYGLYKTHGIEFWVNQDFPILSMVDELWVLKMPGWDQSEGVKEEMEYARKCGIKIVFIDYEYYRTNRKAEAA